MGWVVRCELRDKRRGGEGNTTTQRDRETGHTDRQTDTEGPPDMDSIQNGGIFRCRSLPQGDRPGTPTGTPTDTPFRGDPKAARGGGRRQEGLILAPQAASSCT